MAKQEEQKQEDLEKREGEQEEAVEETESEPIIESPEELERLRREVIGGIREDVNQAEQEIVERFNFFVLGDRGGEEKAQVRYLAKSQERELENLGKESLRQIEGKEDDSKEAKPKEGAERKEGKFEALEIPEEVEPGTAEAVGYELYNSILLLKEQIDAAFLKLGFEGAFRDEEVKARMREEEKLMTQFGIILEQTDLDLNTKDSGPELIAELLKLYRGFSVEMMDGIIDRWEAWLNEQPEWKEDRGHQLSVLFEGKTRELRYSNEEIELAVQQLKSRFAEKGLERSEDFKQKIEEKSKEGLGNAVEGKKPPILPGETFDPEKETKRVRQRPKEEQRQALAEFKEKLAYQKEGLEGMQRTFMAMIRINPDIFFTELYEELDTFRYRYGLTFQQEKTTRMALMKYMRKHEAIKEVREKNPDSEQLFAALFGREPKGKIEIIEGPMTIYVRCHNLIDYAFVCSQAFLEGRDALAPEEVSAARMTGGANIPTSLAPGLEGVINVENAGGRSFEERARATFIHEEQHAIKKLFQESDYPESALQKLESAKTDEERRLLIEGYYRRARKRESDARMKDEILAYFKEDEEAEWIIGILLKPREEGGLYDYIAEKKGTLPAFLVQKLGEEHRDLIEKASEKVFVAEHKRLVEDSVDAFVRLRNGGYSTRRAIAILITEPLGKWKKVVKRLLEQKKEQ